MSVEYPGWFRGPDIPETKKLLDLGHEIVSNDESLFYINTYANSFYKLECSGSIQNCEWKKMDQQLRNPREHAVTLMLPDYMSHRADCT